jgi:hypothetical protein
MGVCENARLYLRKAKMVLEEEGGGSALLAAARVRDAVLGFGLTQRSRAHREWYPGSLRPMRNKAMRLGSRGRDREAGALRCHAGESRIGTSVARHPTHAMMLSISAAALGHGGGCAHVEERRRQREAEQHRYRNGQQTPHPD